MSYITGGTTTKQINDWFALKPIESLKTVPRTSTKPEKPREPVPLRTNFKPRYMRIGSNSEQPLSPLSLNFPLSPTQTSAFPPINRPPPLPRYQHSLSSPQDDISYFSPSFKSGPEMSERPSSPGSRSDVTYLTGLTSGTSHTFVTQVSAMDKLYGYGDFHGEPPPLERTVIDKTHVFERYTFDKPAPTHLPIYQHKDQILETIEKHAVTIVQGSTGSGKTTQVPQYILEYHAKRGLHCNIVCTQPRKIAAISIARRVCHERGWQLGTMVGYQISMDKVTSEDTRLSFVTTGILLQKLVNQKDMTEYTHVILDEVHERDLDTDFVMLVCKYLLQTNSARTKLVLMSATFNVNLFSNYFNVYQEGLLTPAPIVSIGGKNFPVMEFYLDDLKSSSVQDLENPKLADDCVKLAAHLINGLDSLEANEIFSGETVSKGTVLVFLPGLPEIMMVHSSLGENCNNLTILPLHSSIGTAEQHKIFLKPPPGKRKVILSTNIAESSITVPDIRYVIDFCLVKELICDFSTNYQCLSLNWASKASMMQRRGRAGRVAEGRVYRLISRNFYHKCREYTLPEIKRCPLERVVLQTKVLDIGAPVEVLNMSLEQPEALEIERTVLLLKEIGALSSSNMDPFDGELTFLGRVCERLPIDIRMGKLLLLGYVFGCLEECLVIAASLSVKNFFSRPYGVGLRSYRSKVRWARNTFSDPIAMLNAYREWYCEKKSGKWDSNRHDRMEQDWCTKNLLQWKRINEVHELVKELNTRLSKFNINSTRSILPRSDSSSSHDTLLIKLVMAGAFYPNYFKWSEVDEQEAERTMSGHDPQTTVMVSGLPQSRHNEQSFTPDIIKFFEQCGRISQIHYDSSRAYIEFQRLRVYSDEWDSALSVPGSSLIVPAVYTALKLRQLKNGNIVIPIKSPPSSSGQRRDQSGRSSPQCSTLSPPSWDWKKSGVIDILVTEIVNAGHFWAQEVSEESKRVSQQLSDQIGSISYELVPLQLANVDQYCLALFPDDGMHYRGRIVEVYQYSLKIHYLDFGNVAELGFDQVFEIPPALLTHPLLCAEFFLAKVRPSFKESSEGHWTDKANEFFSEMFSQKVLRARIYSQVKGTLRVYLYTRSSGDLASDNCEENDLVNQILIDRGFALYSDESFMSTSAHERADIDENYSSKVWETNSQLARSPVRSLKYDQLYLKGPSTPYEVNFYSLTKIGRMKTARIERDSVNSVCLHYEPQDKHERLMISNFVALNSSASAVIASETTLMPNINGLIHILTLLFSPYVEMRTDEIKRSYIGALCGLGFDNTNLPYFPEHDIEIAFDTAITQEDMEEINAIRLAANLALKCDHDFNIPWNNSFVQRNQKNLKRQLLSLVLKESRPSVSVTHFPRAYSWAMTNPSDLIDNRIVQDEDCLPPVYPLHNLIHLTSYDPRTHCIPARVLILRRKMHELQALATPSHVPMENLFCELCNARCQTPAELSGHISSKQHILRSLALMDDSSYQEIVI